MQTSDWLPISTAPKDRLILIAITHVDGERLIEVAKYDAGAEGRSGGDFGPFVWASQGSNYGIWARDIATHWMPLPSPPADHTPSPFVRVA